MDKTTKIVIWLVVLALVAWGFSALSKKAPTTPASGEVIKIGYIGPFTGPVAGTSGEDVANGFKLAVSERNEIAGRLVEVIYEDDACDPKKAVSAAQKLINIDKVKILVNGVCSGSNVAIGPVAEQAKVILFTPVSTSPKITDLGDYVFRTSGSAVHTARAMNDFLVSKKYVKVALMYENQEYTVGIKDALLSQGLSPVISEGFNTNDTDLRTHILKVSQVRPDVLVLITNSTVTGVAAVKQLKDLEVALPVLANEYFAFSTVVENPDAEGIYATQYKYDSLASEFTDFLQRYNTAYGKFPSQSIYAALPYDGYNVLADAIEACAGDDPECLKRELYSVRGYQGITGAINIDANGDTEREFVVKQIRDKKLVDIN